MVNKKFSPIFFKCFEVKIERKLYHKLANSEIAFIFNL